MNFVFVGLHDEILIALGRLLLSRNFVADVGKAAWVACSGTWILAELVGNLAFAIKQRRNHGIS
jgi:hypothetical protein